MSEYIKKIALSGNTVEAIKLAREKWGIGLKQAKDVVDQLMSDTFDEERFASNSKRIDSNHDSVVVAITQLLKENRKIEAIKVATDTFKFDLQMAKAYVESLNIEENSSNSIGLNKVDRHFSNYVSKERKVEESKADNNLSFSNIEENPQTTAQACDFETEVQSRLHSGGMTSAVALVRERLGLSLADSMEYVDNLRQFGVGDEMQRPINRDHEQLSAAAVTRRKAPVITFVIIGFCVFVGFLAFFVTSNWNVNSNAVDPARSSIRHQVELADDRLALVVKMISSARDGDIEQVQNFRAQIESSPPIPGGNRKTARSMNTEGLRYLSQQKNAEAVATFSAAMKIAPGDVEVINNLAYAYLRDGDIQGAKKFAIHALAIVPTRSAAWANLAEAFAIEGNDAQAVTSLELAYRFSRDTAITRKFIEKLAEDSENANIRRVALRAVESLKKQSSWIGN